MHLFTLAARAFMGGCLMMGLFPDTPWWLFIPVGCFLATFPTGYESQDRR